MSDFIFSAKEFEFFFGQCFYKRIQFFIINAVHILLTDGPYKGSLLVLLDFIVEHGGRVASDYGRDAEGHAFVVRFELPVSEIRGREEGAHC